MFRTPAKRGSLDGELRAVVAGTATVTKTAGPPHQSVRRSIGEWESGLPDPRNSLTPPKSSPTVGRSKPKPSVVRRLSVEAEGAPPKTKGSKDKSSDRVKEARACVCTAKQHLTHSRNLKTDIKVAVNAAIDRLFQLVKDADAELAKCANTQPGPAVFEAAACALPRSPPAFMEGALSEHMRLLRDSTEQIKKLQETLDSTTSLGSQKGAQSECFDQLLGEVRELRQTSEETGRKVSCLQEAVPSYAEVLARPTAAVPRELHPKHSVIVSSGDDRLTSDHVLGQVRDALEARTTGLQVTRVQKVRNQKVVLSCASKEELLKVSERIKTKDKGLIVEEAKNKDPLVMIRNLLTFNKDSDIVSSLRSQNKSLLRDLGDDDFRATVKYRRRARNPHENHVVLQVSPKLWMKLVEAKRVHVDLQYAVVQDQSPLVQCTRCLGYGHGRRQCTESADLCSFCAGPHLRADCPAHTAGETAVCRNCRLAKYPDFGHNAFDGECPVRKRWDAIARSSVAYC